MRRATTVGFAVFASLLVVSVAPAGAMDTAAQADGLVVGSQHTTDGDFETAQALENMTVAGSGESAYVSFRDSTASFTDDFSTLDTSEWSLYDRATYDSSSERVDIQPGGSTYSEGRVEYERGTPASSFNASWDYTDSDNNVGFYTLIFDADGLDVSDQGDGSNLSNGYRVTWQLANNGINIMEYNNGSATSLASVDKQTPDARYKVEVDRENGRIAVYQDGSKVVEATNVEFNSSYSKMGWAAWHNSNTARHSIDNVDISGGADSGTYVSPSHDVSGAKQAAIHIPELSEVSVDLAVEYYDGSSWQAGNSTTVTSTGNHTFTLPDVDSSDWRVRADVNATGSDAQFHLADESILFTPHSPGASNASPADNETLTSQETTLSVDVNDFDFGTAQGDQVDATFYANGEVVGTDSITSNGTVSTTMTVAGETEWYVELNDSYGTSTTTATRTFQTPQELRIYNESAPSQLIDNASVQIRFYYDGDPERIVERNTTNGTIDMTGLPADRSFVVVADADGYLPRRIYVPSLYEEQSIYLLNDSKEHVSPEFVLEDYTGRFGEANTVMLIQRGLNGSWETVQGDYFGATGSFPAQLRYNTRHRLILINTQTGERQKGGTYTPLTSGEHTVQVRSDDEIEIQRGGASITVTPSTRSLAAVNGSSIDVMLDAQSENISTWTATAYYRNGTANETLYAASFTGPEGGSVSPSLDLSNRSGGNVTVVVDYETNLGYTDTETIVFNLREQYDNEYSLLDTLGSLQTLVPDSNWDMLTTFLSVFLAALITTMVGSSIRASTEVLGLTAVGSLAGFAVIGWLGYHVVFAGGVAWVTLTAIRRGV
jgi:hypothetical protein